MGYREHVPEAVADAIAAVVKDLDSNEIRRMRYGIEDILSAIEQETRDNERWGKDGRGR